MYKVDSPPCRSFRPRHNEPAECFHLLIAFSSTDNYRDFPHCKGGVIVSTHFLLPSIRSNSVNYKPRLKTVSYSIVPTVLARSVIHLLSLVLLQALRSPDCRPPLVQYKPRGLAQGHNSQLWGDFVRVLQPCVFSNL